jgi:hypothetical protein
LGVTAAIFAVLAVTLNKVDASSTLSMAIGMFFGVLLTNFETYLKARVKLGGDAEVAR